MLKKLKKPQNKQWSQKEWLLANKILYPHKKKVKIDIFILTYLILSYLMLFYLISVVHRFNLVKMR